MPAARGGSSKSASPQTQGRGGRAPAGARQRPAQGAPGPAAAVRHIALSPKWTLAGAGVILACALAATLATGHRAQRLADGTGHAIDGRFGQAGFRLRAVHVQGASPMATADIVRAAGV